MKNSELVTLMTFTSQGEAEIYKALLDSAGIPSVIQNNLLAGMVPLMEPIVDIKLVVSADDQERAKEILTAGFDQQEFEKESDAEE